MPRACQRSHGKVEFNIGWRRTAEVSLPTYDVINFMIQLSKGGRNVLGDRCLYLSNKHTSYAY
jgi:hypothetical protein